MFGEKAMQRDILKPLQQNKNESQKNSSYIEGKKKVMKKEQAEKKAKRKTLAL